jgi:hypothetical protein
MRNLLDMPWSVAAAARSVSPVFLAHHDFTKQPFAVAVIFPDRAEISGAGEHRHAEALLERYEKRYEGFPQLRMYERGKLVAFVEGGPEMAAEYAFRKQQKYI